MYAFTHLFFHEYTAIIYIRLHLKIYIKTFIYSTNKSLKGLCRLLSYGKGLDMTIFVTDTINYNN